MKTAGSIRPRHQIDLLFEIGDDLAARNGVAQFGLERVARLEVALHRLVEPGEAVSPGILRGIHRGIGRTHQRVETRATGVRPRDADRCGDVEVQAVGMEGAGEPRHDRVRHSLDQRGMRRIEREGAGEFIPAEACRKCRGRHCVRDLARDFLQQRIAGRVAMKVVDHLEMVEVEQQQRHRPGTTGGMGEHLYACFRQAAAVEESRQRILRGKLMRAFLRCSADVDFAQQVPIVPPADQDQRDVDQQRDHQRLVDMRTAAEIMLDRVGHGRTAQRDEQQDRHDRDRAVQRSGRQRRSDAVGFSLSGSSVASHHLGSTFRDPVIPRDTCTGR
jgi:hypothetical protein